MNFPSNPYFSLYYQQPFIETILNPLNGDFCQEQKEKYLRILESQNQLLKEKVTILEQKLKKFQQMKEQNSYFIKKLKKTEKQRLLHNCTYLNCQKSYKSTLALNLHIKIKHNGGSIRERQAYAKLIVECERQNKPRPEININFPPNFLQNYRKRRLEQEAMIKQGSI